MCEGWPGEGGCDELNEEMSEEEAGKNLSLCPGEKGLSPLEAVSTPNNEKCGYRPARHKARIMPITFRNNARALGFLYSGEETEAQEGQVTCSMLHS